MVTLFKFLGLSISDRFHLVAMRKFVLAFHYNDFVCLQSALNHGVIVHLRSCLDETLFYCRIDRKSVGRERVC